MPLFYALSVGIHWSVGKYDEAISEFQRAIELDPNSGLAYFLKRDIEKAICTFQKFKELAVYSGWADAGLDLSHVFIGQKENAEKILEGMLEKKKKTHVSSVCIGWLWGALGNF